MVDSHFLILNFDTTQKAPTVVPLISPTIWDPNGIGMLEASLLLPGGEEHSLETEPPTGDPHHSFEIPPITAGRQVPPGATVRLMCRVSSRTRYAHPEPRRGTLELEVVSAVDGRKVAPTP